jgi:hypothetical protein
MAISGCATRQTPHFLSLLRVKPGTTDAEVQAFFGGSSLSSPLMRGPGAELNVLSPAREVQMSWNLPPGTLRHCLLHR